MEKKETVTHLLYSASHIYSFSFHFVDAFKFVQRSRATLFKKPNCL